MRFTTSAIVRAPVEKVWAWWTDYGAAGTEVDVSHGYGTTHRRVVENTGKRVVIREESPLALMGRRPRVLEHEVTLNDGYWLHERVTAPVAFESKWFFESLPGGEGTRITREVSIPGRVPEFLAPLAEGPAKALTARDMEHHIAEFEREEGSGT